MALILADRVKETSTTAGNGVFTLDGAATGYQSFAVVGNGNTTYYCIAGQGTAEWEVGIGTYTSSGTTLARTTVLSNSSATEPSALVFAAGTKDVFVTYPSEKSVNLDASGNATALGTPVAFIGTNITGTASGLTVGTATNSTNTTNTAITNDTTTAATMYPTWVTANTGNLPQKVSSTKLTFKPSTGELSVTAPIAANGLVLNANTVATSYTIAAGFNAHSVGPITVNSGVVVTITSGQRWFVS